MQLRPLILLTVLSITFTARAHAQSCYESSILKPAPFLGNNDEVFKLADGSIWQVKYEYQYLYAYNPSVVICPGNGKLLIEGKQLRVESLSEGSRGSQPTTRSSKRSKSERTSRAKQGISLDDGALRDDSHAREADTGSVIETQIAGDFSGWDGETIFKFTNGQIWQQSSYVYIYHYAYRPKVIIFKTGGGYQMQVEGVDSRISVKQLK
jgi:hypothetical protein